MIHNKTYIITGGNSGLGLECARFLAAKSKYYQIVLACRNMDKAKEAAKQLIDETRNQNIIAMQLDVSSLLSVRNFVKNYNRQGYSNLDGLVCNAGINGMENGFTADGLDCVFETNHLGHFLLVNLIIPTMNQNGHIAVVSSDMHKLSDTEFIWPGAVALAYPDELLKISTIRYSYSKLSNLYFTYELARRLKRSNSKITVNAFNPGFMTETNFSLDKSQFTDEFLLQIKDRVGSLTHSGRVLADMVSDAKYEKITGKYIDRGIEAMSSLLSYSQENALELWQKSRQYSGITEKETLAGFED